MNRRQFLGLTGVASLGGFAGCIGGPAVSDPDNGDTDDNQPDGSEDMAGDYDFSSCEYDLNDEPVNTRLDETHYNTPAEADTISVAVGYTDDIGAEEQAELEAIFEAAPSYSDGDQRYATGRDGLQKCTVAKLSNRDYVEYIVPLPVEEP